MVKSHGLPWVQCNNHLLITPFSESNVSIYDLVDKCIELLVNTFIPNPSCRSSLCQMCWPRLDVPLSPDLQTAFLTSRPYSTRASMTCKHTFCSAVYVDLRIDER